MILPLSHICHIYFADGSLTTDNYHKTFFFRSVIWLQKCRDDILERLRGGSLKKEEQYEYHIGRLRQDRVKIPRQEGVSYLELVCDHKMFFQTTTQTYYDDTSCRV